MFHSGDKTFSEEKEEFFAKNDSVLHGVLTRIFAFKIQHNAYSFNLQSFSRKALVIKATTRYVALHLPTSRYS